MPLYEYQSATGDTIDVQRSVEDRNKPVLHNGSVFERLKTIPDTLRVIGSKPSESEVFDQKILKGYYDREQKEGSRFRSEYSKKQIAKVYENARRLS